MRIVADLRKYYRNKGILSTSFNCAYKHQCQSDCADFTGPKSAYVSTGYEQSTLPRLLFISLDSGSGEKIDKQRLRELLACGENQHRLAGGPQHQGLSGARSRHFSLLPTHLEQGARLYRLGQRSSSAGSSIVQLTRVHSGRRAAARAQE
jgi:hypothetical protein